MEVFYTDASTINNGHKGMQDSRVVITDGKGNILIDQKVGDRTTIEAEGIAITGALKYAIDNHIKKPQVCSDSEWWVKTINFGWNIKKEHLLPIKDRIISYMMQCDAQIKWVPREQSLAGRFIEGKGFPQKKLIVCPHCGTNIEI